jgi:predicted flavoprotein YhiN
MVALVALLFVVSPLKVSAFCHDASCSLRSSSCSPTKVLASRLAIVGDGLAAITAASTAAAINTDTVITLFTTNHNLGSPILVPDLSLNTRQLMERYVTGGRELAGIFVPPTKAKDWLQAHGLCLEEVVFSAEETSLRVVQENAHSILLDTIRQRGVNVRFATVTALEKTTLGVFKLAVDDGSELEADAVILAGDDVQWNTEIRATSTSSLKISKPKPTQLNNLLLDDEPLSRKELADLDKRTKRNKQQMMYGEVPASKKEEADLKRELKKAKGKKQNQKNASENDADADADDDEQSSANVEDMADNSLPQTSCLELVRSLGHSIAVDMKRMPSMFRFTVKADELLKGCSREHIRLARIRCNLEERPKHRLPKVTGPLILSKTELAGSAVARLSAQVAQELCRGQLRATLHIHLAPDIGDVEKLQELLIQSTVDEPDRFFTAACPIENQVIDYDDYDFERGDFRQTVQPIIASQLWTNLCRYVGIDSTLKSCKVPQVKLETLARLMVDVPVAIAGIQPHEECRMLAGVDWKEVDVKRCESKLVKGLYVCGNMLAASGFDGGFNSLSDFSTGCVAGSTASDELLAAASTLKVISSALHK